MSKITLSKKLARLESTHDQLLAELQYVDALMRQVGFADGLETVKATARELIDMEHDEPKENE